MAQGAIKKKAVTKVAKKVVVKACSPRVFAPRKAGAKRDVQMVKRHSAALTSATEKLLSSRVGHLELLKGTRRELEKQRKEKEVKAAPKNVAKTGNKAAPKKK